MIDLRHYESGNFLAKEHIAKRGNPYARKVLFKCLYNIASASHTNPLRLRFNPKSVKLFTPYNSNTLFQKMVLAIIKQQTSTIEQLTNELTLLREQVEYLRQKLYGKSSEKVVHQPGQLSLFGEESLPEEDADLPS
ncbi:transposase [Streptococcus suis]|nr:transposase [Streptococcus suis]CYX02349.1 transposase [Streptococcus suis]